MLTSAKFEQARTGIDQRTIALALLVLGVLLVVVFYRETWADMVRMWRRDSTFGHAFLVVPLAAYAAWQRRHALDGVAFSGNWLAALLVVLAGMGWFLGNVLQVAAVEHVALVLMLQALIWATIGTQAARVMLFPIAFLFFLAPVGKALVPALMHITADLTVLFCRVSGIPVLREGMLMHIPEGTFEVALACSGVKFLIAAVALSVFVADLMFVRWWRRIAFVAFTVVVTVLMNGFRAYILVLIGHLTDMTWEHDRWHIWLGYAMFGATILALVWIAGRLSDHRIGAGTAPAAPVSTDAAQAPIAARSFAPTALAAAALVATPIASGAAASPVSADSAARLVQLADASGEWRALPGAPAWRPHFSGALRESSVRYDSPARGAVDVYVAAYQIGGRGAAEMVSYRNRIQADSNESLYGRRLHAVELEGGRIVEVVETRASQLGGRLVWYWYEIGGRPAHRELEAKVLEGLALLRGQKLERVVVISAAGRTEAAARDSMSSFLEAHAAALELANP